MSLNDAFADLRRQGFVAKMNFSCCSGCAGYELTVKIEDTIEKAVAKGKSVDDEKAKVKGVVTFHQQANDRRKHGESFYVQYGPVESTKFGKIGLDTIEVGKIAVETFARHGVDVEWSGDPNEGIKVLDGQ